MNDVSAMEYYRVREGRERAMARASANPKVAAIHFEMAQRYAELIALGSVSRYMRVVTMPGMTVSA
ncbi:hypothetical protein ACFOKI_15075 [Sphingomonas qilianensis]|uniref:Uncharacterized protein n=1 Tax=Sphingomonas qilianensis TaxID=1736690 RepID=A0ABU9XNY0_9SPHN